MKEKKNFLAAVTNAFNGIKYFFSNERNGKVQLAIAVIAIALSIGLRISTNEWLVVLLCIGLVIGLEMLNTAIEILCDIVQKEHHPAIKNIKDVAAASVLCVSLISLANGLVIFLPKIF